MAGRPTRSAAAKAPQILDVALEVFTVHGYQTASMDMIAAQARMSKQTLYRHFGSKEQLFVHVVQALIERSPVRVPPAPVSGSGRELRALLIAFADQLATAFCEPKTVQTFRLVTLKVRATEQSRSAFLRRDKSVAAHPLWGAARGRNRPQAAQRRRTVRSRSSADRNGERVFPVSRLLGRPSDFGTVRQKQIVGELSTNLSAHMRPRKRREGSTVAVPFSTINPKSKFCSGSR